MKTKLTAIFFATAAAVLSGAPGSNLNMAALQTVSGAVTAVHIGYGMQYPSLTINKTQIKVAPVWYLIDRNFEIGVGDVLSVTAAPSRTAGDPYLYAVDITSAAGVKIALRDPNGIPLWTNGNTSGGQTAACGCLSGSTTATASGTIDRITSGVGIQMPTLVLKTADGKLLTVRLGPERVLLASNLELKTGDAVTVQYAVSCQDELVALSITDATGTTATLRDGTGRPLWN